LSILPVSKEIFMIALRPLTAALISVVFTLLPFQGPGPTNTTAIPSWFTSNDNAVGDDFGVRMSMSGDTVVIGAPHDSRDASWSGSAYVFVKDGAGWVQQQKLLPTTPIDNQVFGLSVSIDGDTIVVGCPGEGDANIPFAGAAYVFVRDRSNWVLHQKLLLPDVRFGVGFGGAVAISGDSIVVTASGDGDDNFLPGTASVFTRDQNGVWSFQQKFRASDQIRDQMYGGSVAISGDTVLVGSEYLDPQHGAAIGAVYVYERVGTVWTERKKLTSSTWRGGYEFGRYLAIDGNIAAIGAYHEEHGSNTRGSVYVFVRDKGEWIQQQKLFVKEELAEMDFFGVSVTVHGSTIIAGNSGADEERGAAYIFTADDKLNWSQQTKLVPGDGLIDEHFGTAVATNGSEILVGAPGKAITGPSCGAVYYTGP
jgi:FG-GAP repeat